MDFKEFRYPKPLRLNIGLRIGKKRYMSVADEKYLLSGKVIIEEKMDGKQTTVRSDDLRFIFCVEDLKTRHSIPYRVPARYAVFDMFSLKRGSFLSPEEKDYEIGFFLKHRDLLPAELSQGGIFPVRQLASGVFTPTDLPNMITMSHYALDLKNHDPGFMEGIVVKPDRELFYEEYLSGKIVRTEFLKGITTHYLRMRPEYNEINPSLGK